MMYFDTKVLKRIQLHKTSISNLTDLKKGQNPSRCIHFVSILSFLWPKKRLMLSVKTDIVNLLEVKITSCNKNDH